MKFKTYIKEGTEVWENNRGYIAIIERKPNGFHVEVDEQGDDYDEFFKTESQLKGWLKRGKYKMVDEL